MRPPAFVLLSLLLLPALLAGCSGGSTPPPAATGEAPSRTHKGGKTADAPDTTP